MPELPDIEDYRAALRARIVGHELQKVLVKGISLLRSYDPPLHALEGQEVTDIRRIGKRLVFVFGRDPDGTERGDEDRLFGVLHLMIAGRLKWVDQVAAKPPGKIGVAAFHFAHGTLILTEASTKKRARFHVERGEAALAEHDRGGIEPLTIDLDTFADVLRSENRTMKRALTDQRKLSGIGNAFSDEILLRARLSPVKRTKQLTDDEIAALHLAMQDVLNEWTAILRAETGDGFPTNVTAFRTDFAAHGKYGEPCPQCDEHSPIQRIQYASNETNYCATCQTGGKVLADRSLSRLLKDDWPTNIEELE